MRVWIFAPALVFGPQYSKSRSSDRLPLPVIPSFVFNFLLVSASGARGQTPQVN